MQITDEMVVTAINAGCSSEDDGTATLHAFNCYCDKCKKRMRAALEAALGQQQGKKYSAADNLRNWAKAKATEDNDSLRADLLSNAACIEGLAWALKEISSLADVDADNRSTIARSVLEKWGLK